MPSAGPTEAEAIAKEKEQNEKQGASSKKEVG
jgi:hypothetical protein